MMRLHDTFLKKKFNRKMILQVHDELLFECVKSEVDEIARVVKQIMCDAYKLDAPLDVEVKIGNNWQEMQVVNE